MDTPKMHTTKIDLVFQENVVRLRKLIGHPIEHIWVVWIDDYDDIHPATPVILSVDGRRIELWTVYVAEFSITWETVDLASQPFVWLKNHQDSGERWVEAPLEELKSAKGRLLKQLDCSRSTITVREFSLGLRAVS